MRASRLPRAFTLIELLTVIGIIALLIAILLPSLNSARTQARNSATAAQIDAIGKGNEMFKNDNGAYPQSRGVSPFYKAPRSLTQGGPNGTARLYGAQWIALQLSGADLGGFVQPTLQNDTNNNDKINHTDWNEWYSLKPDREYPRARYTNIEGRSAGSLNDLIESGVIESFDKSLIKAASKPKWWGTGDLPTYLDSFGLPILYYRANAGARQAFTTGNPGDSNFKVGLYDQTDNGGFTGTDGANGAGAGRVTPMGFAGQSAPHTLGTFKFKADRYQLPEQDTFENFLVDRKVFKATQRGSEGTLRPYRPDSYVIISAGKDARYGTADDVRNFQPGG